MIERPEEIASAAVMLKLKLRKRLGRRPHMPTAQKQLNIGKRRGDHA
jgi:hypothetical protein